MRTFVPRLIFGVLAQLCIFGVLLLLPAGTLAWPRVWLFLGVVAVASAASMITIYRDNPAVLDERFKPPIQQGQPLGDKVVVLSFVAAFFALVMFIPLDVFRFHLMGEPGPVVSFVGLVVFVLGWWIMSLALRENAFAAPVVRHQAERGQTVIDTGVYGWVRHPMYTGGVLLVIGMPLWLGSYAAALLASIPIAVLALRISIEERFLRRALDGYDAYTTRVRYRLIPFFW